MRFLSPLLFLLLASPLRADGPPNILLILADDLGYGDPGCYGQKEVLTPNIDKLAKEGMRFTQCYAGSTVCAPSRCSLMTGLHTGHTTIRGNANVPLRPEDKTVAELLKAVGYTTGLIGKWGLGDPGTTGTPNAKGFDHFFGYLNQTHAHNYYPDYLYRNADRVPIPQNEVAGGIAKTAAIYSPSLLRREALDFIDRNQSRPFFLAYTTILPHANNERGKAEGNGMEIPDAGIYAAKPWPAPQKNHAAMIGRLDDDVGALMAKLSDRGLDKNTLVIFTSDNGPHNEGGAIAAFFHSSGPLRGIKRAVYEGGIRVPGIVRWPGQIAPGTSDHPWAFWDFLPTMADFVGRPIPLGIDGISILPTLLRKGRQKSHEFFYWEFHEGGSKQAVRTGDWKAVRNRIDKPLELYDLAKDVGENDNVAEENADVVAKIEAYLKTARTESKEWPLALPVVGKKK